MKRLSLAALAIAILAMPGVGLAKGPKSPKKCQAHPSPGKVAGNL